MSIVYIVSGQTDRNCIAVTSGGNLPCRFIIHLEAGAKSWKTLVQNSLKAAEKQQLTSIAMPALGTGNMSPKPFIHKAVDALSYRYGSCCYGKK